MKTLAAFYFTGTGNTRYIADRLCKKLAEGYRTELYDITSADDFTRQLAQADVVLLAFPIYGSAPPIPMRQFVHRNGRLFNGKDVLIVETQYFFSGDGAATIGRTVKKFGANIVGAEHFNMPNNLADCKLFPIKNAEEQQKTLARAEKRMDAFARRILRGKAKKRGFGVLSHAVGYFCQRKYWWKGEAAKRKHLKIDGTKCVGCQKCTKNCPVSNLEMQNGKAHALGKCALCYRCINLCPRRAITLIGSAPPEKQYKGPHSVK